MCSDAKNDHAARLDIRSGTVDLTLRQHLLGAWVLMSYIEYPIDGSPERYPFGEDAKGLLIYSSDGFMSVQLMPQDRRPFRSGDWFQATASELRNASAFVAYSGRFSVDEAAGKVTHEIAVSFFPNWIGRTQVRLAGVQDKDFVLRPDTPIRSWGKDVIPNLRWKRAAQ
jgi:hypothetical protein